MTSAAEIRDQGHGDVVSFSKKVFIPLTRLYRDVCHYCTYAKTPSIHGVAGSINPLPKTDLERGSSRRFLNPS